MIVEKFAINRLYHEAIPMNWRICFTVRGSGQLATALIFSGSVLIPSRSIICPRYRIWSTQNLHLSGFSRRCAFRRRRKVSVSNSRCSLNVLLMMIISSRYTNTCGSKSGPRTVSSNRWNVAGAECNPNGITLKWNRPFPGTVNAVIGRLSGVSGIANIRFSSPVWTSIVPLLAYPELR